MPGAIRSSTPAPMGSFRPRRHLPGSGGFTLQALVMPTTPGKGRQGVLGTWSETGHTGASLIVGDDGAAGLAVGDGIASAFVTTGVAMVARAWYRLAASFDPATGEVRLVQEPVDGGHGVRVTRRLTLDPVERPGQLLMAAWHRAHPDGRGTHAGCFNGRIEAPRVAARALSEDEISIAQNTPGDGAVRDAIIAAWDFSRDIDGEAAGRCLGQRSPRRDGAPAPARRARLRLERHRDELAPCAGRIRRHPLPRRRPLRRRLG